MIQTGSTVELALADRKRWPKSGRYITYGQPVAGITASYVRAWTFVSNDPINCQVLIESPSRGKVARQALWPLEMVLRMMTLWSLVAVVPSASDGVLEAMVYSLRR